MGFIFIRIKSLYEAWMPKNLERDNEKVQAMNSA